MENVGIAELSDNIAVTFATFHLSECFFDVFAKVNLRCTYMPCSLAHPSRRPRSH